MPGSDVEPGASLYSARALLPYLHLGPLPIGTYGLMAWFGFVAAYFLLRAELQRRRLPGNADTIIVVLALAGLAGSKLYHVLETPQQLLADPVGRIFSNVGFAWFGGFLGGILALWLLGRRYNIGFFTMLDAASPAAAIGYAIGRIGCLLSGDGDYGIPTDLPWGMSFPNGLVPTTERVHPTPLYEFLAGAAICYYLWRRGGRALAEKEMPGVVTAYYLVLTGVARFLVEFIRLNPPLALGLSNAQWMSVASMVAGIALLLWSRRPGAVPARAGRKRA